MTTRSTVTRTITVQIEVDVKVTVEWEHDPGVYRDANGDGCPPSSDPTLKEASWDAGKVVDAINKAVEEAIDSGELDDNGNA